MKEMKILQAMNMVDDEYLEEMNMENKKEPGRKRNVLKLFLIAALVAVLGVSVLAYEYTALPSGWFYSFFAGSNHLEEKGELTDNQKELLNSGLVEINQSITVDGWTITMESGISDGYHMLVKYRVNAPEDVVLDPRYSLDFFPVLRTAEGKEIDWNGPVIAQWTIEDEDPNDNSMTRLIDCTGGSTSQGGSVYLPDGVVVYLDIWNISKTMSTGEEIVREQVFEKNLGFEVELGEACLARETVELTEETYCSAKRRSKGLEFDIKLKVISVELRALSATIKFEMPTTDWGDGIFIDPLYVVMSDGTAVESERRRLTDRGDYIECIVTFGRPIVVEDVAYVDFQ